MDDNNTNIGLDLGPGIEDDNVVWVCCMCLPDGDNVWWAPATPDQMMVEAEKIMNAWKARVSIEKQQKYEDAGVLGGMVMVRMLREDWDNQPHPGNVVLLQEAGL